MESNFLKNYNFVFFTRPKNIKTYLNNNGEEKNITI